MHLFGQNHCFEPNPNFLRTSWRVVGIRYMISVEYPFMHDALARSRVDFESMAEKSHGTKQSLDGQ